MMVTKAAVSIQKCQKVLWSCKTKGQLQVALNYLTIATNAESSNLSQPPFSHNKLQVCAERINELMEMRHVCFKHINMFKKGNY